MVIHGRHQGDTGFITTDINRRVNTVEMQIFDARGTINVDEEMY
jgi:hypothetical protein